MNANPDLRFLGIDILRGLAAACVVLSHYSSYCYRYFGDAPFHLELIFGYYAVQLFFIISGFVIYYSVERSKTWQDFAISRLTRLYPAYWTALTIVVAAEVLLFNSQFWRSDYLANLTMLQEFLGFPNHDNVFWSLTVELSFYVIIGILFKANLLRRIVPIAAIWLILASAWSVCEKYLAISLPESLSRCLLLPHIPFFLLGIMLFIIYRDGVSDSRVSIVIASFAAIWLIHGTINFEVALVLFAFVVFAISRNAIYLVSPTLVWLGSISYSLYLTHRNLGYLTLEFLHRNGIPTWIAMAATIIGALSLATILTYFIEQPASTALRKCIRGC